MPMKHDNECERTESTITCACASRAYKRDPIPGVAYIDRRSPTMTVQEQWEAFYNSTRTRHF